MRIVFNKERNFNSILNVTFAYIKQEFKPLMKAVLFLSGPVILLSGIIYSFIIPKLHNVLGNPFKIGLLSVFDFSLGNAYWINLALIIISLASIITVTNSYIFLYVSNNAKGFTLNDVAKESLKRFLKILILGVVGTIIVLVGSIVIIPGIYLAVTLMLIFPIAIIGQKDIFDSISRSFDLIKSNWFSSFFLMLFLFIITFFLGIAFYIPLYIINAFFELNAVSLETSVFGELFTTIMTTIAIFLSNLSYTILFIAIAFHYFSLVEKHESPTLQKMISSINDEN